MLTEKQFLVLNFIKKYIASHGYSPTVREIGAGLGLSSTSTVQSHLKKLIENGLITINKNKSRTIELLVENEYVNINESTKKIPILNSIETDFSIDFLEIPLFMIREKNKDHSLYAFKHENSIYIIDKNARKGNVPSLTFQDDTFFIESKPLHKIYGNIISEFKEY